MSGPGAIEQGIRNAIRDELLTAGGDILRQAMADAGTADAYTVDQLAAKWSCSPRQIRQLINDGHLEYVDGVSRSRLIPASSAAEFIRRRACRETPQVRGVA